MIEWALYFLIVAGISAIGGFGVFDGEALGTTLKTLFVFFLSAFVVAVIFS